MSVRVPFEEQRRRLVEYLERLGYVTSPEVKRALLKVPREEFIPEKLRDRAYVDAPLPIGHGQTISAPHMVAMMTELLSPKRGNKVLEVGTGSGYHAAVVAEIVNPDGVSGGMVYTIERIPELAEFARSNLERTGYADRVVVLVGDGSLGYPPAAPYDRILVTAGAPRIPRPLLEQLAKCGKMVIPVGGRFEQVLAVVEKTCEGDLRVTYSIPCVFVPLIGKEGWET